MKSTSNVAQKTPYVDARNFIHSHRFICFFDNFVAFAQCYMKLVTDKSRNETVVGFHVLCDNAGEITQGMALAIKLRATKV